MTNRPFNRDIIRQVQREISHEKAQIAAWEKTRNEIIEWEIRQRAWEERVKNGVTWARFTRPRPSPGCRPERWEFLSMTDSQVLIDDWRQYALSGEDPDYEYAIIPVDAYIITSGDGQSRDHSADLCPFCKGREDCVECDPETDWK